MDILVDSNVILDILTEDPSWLTWSADNLARLADTNILVINPIIYSEVSIRFDRIEELDDTLDPMMFRRDPIPWEAAFLAEKSFLRIGVREAIEHRLFLTFSLAPTPRYPPCPSLPETRPATANTSRSCD